jgi:hypothetical protein
VKFRLARFDSACAQPIVAAKPAASGRGFSSGGISPLVSFSMIVAHRAPLALAFISGSSVVRSNSPSGSFAP